MPTAAQIPTTKGADLVTATVKVNGTDIPADLNGLVIEKEVNRIPAATLVLGDGDVAKQDFELSSGDWFVPGNTLEVHLGYHGEESLLFKGMVVKQRIEIRASLTQLEVECRDVAYQMTLRRHSAYFENNTDSEIAEQLLDEYGLPHNVAPTEYKYPEQVQYDATDWDFLQMRMETNGLLTIVENGRVCIQPPDFEQDPALRVTHGSDVLEFEGELEVRDQFPQRQMKAWDYTNQALLEIDAEEPNIKTNGNLPGPDIAGHNGEAPKIRRHGGKVVEDELRAWADAALLRDRLSRTRGRVRFKGDASIKPGHLLLLQGFGDRFNGPVFAAGVRHEMYGGSWTTDVEFGLSPQCFAHSAKVEAPPAAGILPAVSGLQYGTVTQIEDDPNGDFRIKVRLPIVDDQAPGVWARLATLDAGANRGTVFYPEVDDEVIVGFVNDDPREAVVLGMLHSSKQKAPFAPEKKNKVKGYRSREGLGIAFQEEDKSITLETPGGNKLAISDKDKGLVLSDQHGNSITMNKDGLTLKSAKDVKIEAQNNLQTKATSAWQAQGTQVQLKGNAVTEIKGNPVNIN